MTSSISYQSSARLGKRPSSLRSSSRQQSASLLGGVLGPAFTRPKVQRGFSLGDVASSASFDIADSSSLPEVLLQPRHLSSIRRRDRLAKTRSVCVDSIEEEEEEDKSEVEACANKVLKSGGDNRDEVVSGTCGSFKKRRKESKEVIVVDEFGWAHVREVKE